MDRENEAIRDLVAGPHCIFALSPIQYPNERQQRYFLAYSTVFQILRNDAEPDRTFQEMIFKNSSANLRTIVHGLLYFSLLNHQHHPKVFSHIQLLRNEGMKLYVECVADVTTSFIQLLGEGFSQLKDDVAQLLPQICRDFARYKLLNERMVVLLLKTVNSVDPTELQMNYSWKVIEVLEDIIREAGSVRGFGRYIFLKLLKLLTLLYVMVDEEGIREFRQDCQRLALQIWELDNEECLLCGNEVFRYHQELIPYAGQFPQLTKLMRDYKELYPTIQQHILSMPWHERQSIMGVNLKFTLTQTLHYLHTVHDPAQIDYQLSWLYRQLELNRSFDLLVIDMLRYVLRVLEDNESKLTILDRFINHCWSKPVLCECARQALFFDWFVKGTPSDEKLWELAFPGLRVLQMEFGLRVNTFERMLEYVLLQNSGEQQPSRVKDNLKRILLLADAKGLIQLQLVLTHPVISISVKQELTKLLTVQGATESEKKEQYNPFGHEELDQSGIHSEQKDIDWEEEQYNSNVNSSISNGNGNGVPVVSHEDLQDYLELQLEKEFVEETGSKLSLLLGKPTKDSYQQLAECVIGLIRKANQRNEPETVTMLYNEVVKLTYILFQSHFEQFWLVDKDTNVLGWLVEKMQANWACTSLELLFYRRVIRELGKVFKITPYATTFMLFFRVGHHRAHAKQILQFLTEGLSKDTIGLTLKNLIDEPGIQSEASKKAIPFGIHLTTEQLRR